MSSGRSHRAAYVVTALCTSLVIAVVAGWPVYVCPQVDQPRRADAVFVLGGADYGRYPFGFELGTQGWARTVVVSNPNGTDDPWLSETCRTPQAAFELICFSPTPATTRGEGQELRRLAAERGWSTVIVVTSRPHISRARFILARCFTGELVMVATPTPTSIKRWAFEYIAQTAGYIRAVLQPGC